MAVGNLTKLFDWYTAWVDQHLALTVTIARKANLHASDLFAAFEVDPSTIADYTFDGADDIIDVHRVRVGRRDGWCFAIEHFSLAGTSDAVSIASRRMAGRRTPSRTTLLSAPSSPPMAARRQADST